jgi:hypothetical protein
MARNMRRVGDVVRYLLVTGICVLLVVAAWRSVMPTADVPIWRGLLGWTMTFTAAYIWHYSVRRTPTKAELLDHIKGMRMYYTGPAHQSSQGCVCRECVDAKLLAWSKPQTLWSER